ncbi:MAG: DUF3576 domain-containing protein [Alphaproteobacteria bacterium]
MKKLALIVCILSALAACSDNEVDYNLPQEREDTWRNRQGKLTGESGLVILGRSDDESAASPIGVNSYLWRATLDTLSFMPLVSADPFGGVIITDWYEDPKTPGERFKVNALILDRTLRADGVKVTLFKQKKTGRGWTDQKVDDNVARTLEDTILTRARELRVNGK